MNSDITSSLRPALVMTILFAVLLGIGYPLAMTGIGQLFFPHAANGSVVVVGGRTIGSELVGQSFAADRYFQTRPSAAGKGYDALASSGSNLGPASKALADRVGADVAKRRAEGVAGPIPADLVTASASGLDPDLSPAAALAQAPRVARVRGLSPDTVRRLVGDLTQRPALGFLGDAHVNVLVLNRRLDAIASAREAR